MSVIIRLQNLPLSANSIDIRNFFRGLAIPDGGVHIVGGSEGDAFIAFSTDEDARQGMQLSGTCLKDSPVKLFLSSRNEMYKVIEQARQQALGLMPVSSSSSSPTENSPLPASQPSQQTPSTASIHSQSSNTLPLSMATGGNSMLPGLGLAYPGANSNSNPPISFPGIGSLGASSVSMGPTNFSGAIGSQGNGAGGYPSVFSPQQTSGPPGPGSLGPRNMNPMNQISQNPFVMSQSTSGNNIPIGFPSNMPNGPMSSNIMGNAATNPNLIGMSSSNMPILSGSNQFGIGAGNRMPMLNSGSGNHPGGIISPFAMGQVPQSGYSGLNPNLMSSANNVGNGNHIGGPMGGNQVRPNFHQNNTSLPNRDNRRLGERPVNNFGKVNAGPMAALRDRDNVGFTARAVDRDTRGRERERGERGKRSQSRSRDRKDARDRSRRRSRSRERSRERRRVRRSKSRSRSRDRERTRSRRGSSRDRDRGREERRRSDAGSGGSPEKGLKGDVSSPAGKFGTLSVDSEKKYIGKDRRDSSVENIVVTITDESSPCAKLSGLSKDTSFREDMDSSIVMISGVPPQTKERSVLDFFSEIGVTPLSVRLMYDQNGAMPNGQVVCEFPDPSKARRATWKDGTLFGRVPVKVSLLPSGNSHNRTNNPSHMGSLAGNHNSSQFPPRGTRPSLLGPRPAIPNSNAARFQSNHQSQNPFTQALQQSMPSPNNSNMMVNVPRLRGPVGERSTRFSSNNGGSGAADREDRSKHGVNRQDDMAPFENPGCVLALENVPFKASMDDILNFLKDMLKIQIPRSRIIRRFDDNQKPTGDARVAFDTPFEAKLAYQRLLGSTMWKRQISVSILSYF